jgi:hypothetical protein
MTTSEMPVPEWVGDLKGKMVEMHSDINPTAKFEVEKLEPIDCFSTLFAEYELKEQDLILHLFPRAGEEDRWGEGRYINRCRNCRAEVPMPDKHSELKPCPKCGHTGLLYIPGRQEEKAKVAFPSNMEEVIKEGVDKGWMGSAAVEFVEELGAYVVQFHNASNTVKVGTPAKFLDPILEHIDSQLETVGNVVV